MKVDRYVGDNKGQPVKKSTQEIFDILYKYWNMCEQGMDWTVEPDPDFEVTEEEVKRIVGEIDDDFYQYEHFRMGIGECEALPEFQRLAFTAQKAMVQEIKKKLLYQQRFPEQYYEEVSNIITVPNPYSNIQFEYHEEGYLTPRMEKSDD